MRCLFEPRLVNEAFGEPGLYVDFRDERRALLFDLGDIRVLPPRKLMRLSHVFVTHAHMDHFAGFDHPARVFRREPTLFANRARRGRLTTTSFTTRQRSVCVRASSITTSRASRMRSRRRRTSTWRRTASRRLALASGRGCPFFAALRGLRSRAAGRGVRGMARAGAASHRAL